MKPHHFSNAQGSVFISAAMAAGVLSIVVAGLLVYMTNEYNLNYRSHAWNRALNLAEAGAEVGFAELDYQYYLGGNGFQSSRGWTNNSGVYTKTVTGLTDTGGNVVGNFTVTVSGINSNNPLLQAVATCPSGSRGPSVSRAVRVTLSSSSHFPVALMTKSKMDLNGNNVYVDSYDSTDATKSTSKLYDPAKAQANGNVASDGTVINSLSIGNADIYGVSYTGVGGTVSIGANGSIGPTFVSADRATTVSSGEADGWIEHDFNVDVPDATLPSGVTWGSVPGNTGGNITKTTTLSSGDYSASSMKLQSSDVLTITGNVRLYISGNVDMLGQITIAPGGSLQVYIGGNVTLKGNGVVNSAGPSMDAEFFGLPTSTSWTVAGNGQWDGTIYAPEAAVSFNGGGSAGDSSGALVANSVTLTGNTRFHYDESLRASDTGAGYSVASWQELRQVGGNWVP